MTRTENYNSENSLILARGEVDGMTYALLHLRSADGVQFAVCRAFDEMFYDGALGYERWDYTWSNALYFEDIVEAVDCWKREVLGGGKAAQGK